MAKLQYQFDSSFELEVEREKMQKALALELCESFGLKDEDATKIFLEFLCSTFFWELLEYLQEEMKIRFFQKAKRDFELSEVV